MYDMYDWRPRLTVKLVLEWADAYHRRSGDWPTQHSGRIKEFLDWTWSSVNQALGKGRFGHPGGTSIVQLLAKHRGRRNKLDLPRLRISQILAWADEHHRRTGDWPRLHSGPVRAAPGETWMAVGMALSNAGRGLPGGSSLARLLTKHRGYLDYNNQPLLKISQILTWADNHRKRTGRWPTQTSGPVIGAPHESWDRISMALREGRRGLAAGSSVARLLAKRRGVRNHMDLPPLTIGQILAWADQHRNHTGEWPTDKSGPIRGAPRETWKAIGHSLRLGSRSLPRGSSLARLLDKYRRKRGATMRST